MRTKKVDLRSATSSTWGMGKFRKTREAGKWNQLLKFQTHKKAGSLYRVSDSKKKHKNERLPRSREIKKRKMTRLHHRANPAPGKTPKMRIIKFKRE